MGTSYSSCFHSTTLCTHSLLISHPKASAFNPSRFPNPSFKFHSTNQIPQTHLRIMSQKPSQVLGGKVEVGETQEGVSERPMIDFHGIDEGLVEKMVYDALVWSSLHGLLVGDKSVQVCGCSCSPESLFSFERFGTKNYEKLKVFCLSFSF